MKKLFIALTLLTWNASAQLEFLQDTIAYNERFHNRKPWFKTRKNWKRGNWY